MKTFNICLLLDGFKNKEWVTSRCEEINVNKMQPEANLVIQCICRLSAKVRLIFTSNININSRSDHVVVS